MNPLSDDDRTLESQKTTPDTLQGNLFLEKAGKLNIFETSAVKRITQEFNYWLHHLHAEFKCFLADSVSPGNGSP